jgi:hypothetical protein
MPGYDDRFFSPPAPVARIALREPQNDISQTSRRRTRFPTATHAGFCLTHLPGALETNIRRDSNKAVTTNHFNLHLPCIFSKPKGAAAPQVGRSITFTI